MILSGHPARADVGGSKNQGAEAPKNEGAEVPKNQASEAQVGALAEIEIYKDTAFEIPNRYPGVEMVKNLNSHFKLFSKLIAQIPDLQIARYGALTQLRSMKQLGLESEAERLSVNYLNTYFATCQNFSDCANLIRDLAGLTEVNPAALAELITYKLVPTLSQLTRKLSANSRAHLSNSLTQRILLYRAESLKIACQFNIASGLYLTKSANRNPRMFENQKIQLKSDLQNIETEVADLIPAGLKPFEDIDMANDHSQQQIIELVDSVTADFSELEKKDFSKTDLAKKMAGALIDSLVQTSIGNQATLIYLNRVNQNHMTKFFDQIDRLVMSGQVSKEVVLVMAMRFMSAETLLPFRHEWVGLLRKYATVGQSQDELIATADSLEKVIGVQEQSIQEYLAKQNLSNQSAAPTEATYGALLFQNEKMLAETYPEFNSLSFQIAKLTKYENQLGARGLLVKKFQTQHSSWNHSKEKDELAEGFLRDHDAAVGQYLTLACFAHASASFSAPAARTPAPSFRNLKIFFSDADTYSVQEACNPMRWSGPEVDVIEYISKKRTDKIMLPAKIEFAVTLLSVPISVVSGGVAGLASEPIAALTTRALGQAFTKYALSETSMVTLNYIIPRVTSAVAGAVVFTLTQRSLLYAVSLGNIPLYDSTKSLWANYGQDLIMGSAIFFVLPYANHFHQIWSAKVAGTEFLTARPFLRQLTRLGIEGAGDLKIFTSLTYLERVIENQLSQSKDPVINGWNDFAKVVGQSAAMSLGFRVRSAALY